mmetsp:Transcript_7375/g.11798  ORF Transcript_7375/g.11798 Transcript_7375/m.11798 type:complete len:413 (+) Transcript_7375:278-1516(+)
MKADVVVVGGGIVGCCTGYFLKKIGGKGLRVAIVERDNLFRTASTVLSAGGVRLQFSLKENIQMSQFMPKFFEEVRGENDEENAVQFVQDGYLFLSQTEDGAKTLKENCSLQKELGVQTDLLSPDRIKETFPWLNTDDLVAGSLGTSNEGWFDPWSLLRQVRAKAQAQGVRFYENVHVDSFSLSDGEGASKVSKVHLNDGETIECGSVIVAAGAWSGHIASKAGVSLPVEPRIRSVYAIRCPDAMSNASMWCPLTINPSGVYFRRESAKGSGMFICGRSPDACDDQPFDSNMTVEDIHHLFGAASSEYFENNIWPELAHRSSVFEQLKVVSSWSGFYDYNTLDQNAIIGPSSKVPNLYVCSGFSGHGLQQAPAAARAVCELLLSSKFESLDLTRFSFERLAKNQPIFETNIV